MHVGDDLTGPFLLALGITSARDPGNNNILTLARAKRRANGELLFPMVYPSMLIDGKGPNTAQVGHAVTSPQEAIAAVDRAKAEGFTGIKFYGTYNPAWVAPAAAEAHKLVFMSTVMFRQECGRPRRLPLATTKLPTSTSS